VPGPSRGLCLPATGLCACSWWWVGRLSWCWLPYLWWPQGRATGLLSAVALPGLATLCPLPHPRCLPWPSPQLHCCVAGRLQWGCGVLSYGASAHVPVICTYDGQGCTWMASAADQLPLSADSALGGGTPGQGYPSFYRRPRRSSSLLLERSPSRGRLSSMWLVPLTCSVSSSGFCCPRPTPHGDLSLQTPSL
jgi:hypothetical protein